MRLPIDVVTILPVEPIGKNGLEELRDVLQGEGIEVILKPPILRPPDAYDARRRQFRAEALLQRARSCAERPIVAVTDADCYAGSLNFVFGIAEVGGRAAAVSLHRLRGASTDERFHQRMAKEVIHELGHGEGLGHCRDPKCVMRFSNSLAETDAKSKELCPACLRHLRTRAAARTGRSG